MLEEARTRHGLQVKLSWLEKLGRWEDALREYERSQMAERAGARVGEFAVGRMRCLSALAEWGQLARLADGSWAQLNGAQQREVAPLLSEARWYCHEWEAMQSSVVLVSAASYEGGFYRAVLASTTGATWTARTCLLYTSPSPRDS